ncbi:DUF4239 domain-containing protein [Phytoactinopolyspora endophytica]|uniref:bestrophin-like domain n=1 Tax=Phytoactinopolyspora endophytica TaxID=1642495 RepID=UPI00101D11CE|nr:DUF4239 domain-containing protein [Phytoactinopolyspora endophytica]
MSPTPTASTLILISAGVLVAGLCLPARRLLPRLASTDTSPWSSTLSYVATAYGIVVGFSIIFLFGEFSAARQAVGDEATSVGTAFEEARLFPGDSDHIQHALICYARAVPEFDWPALSDRSAAPEVDQAYRDIFLALGEAEQPAQSTFQPATATNILVQVGNISTAREARLVAAGIQIPTLLWVLLLGGGLLVVALIFVVTVAAHPVTQAVLVGLSAMFTVVMILIVAALGAPFAAGTGRVAPKLIEETTASMEQSEPELASQPCDHDDGE